MKALFSKLMQMVHRRTSEGIGAETFGLRQGEPYSDHNISGRRAMLLRHVQVCWKNNNQHEKQ